MDVELVVNLNGEISDAIGFTRNEKLLVVQYLEDLISFGPESRERKDFDIDGQGDSFFLRRYIKQSYFYLEYKFLILSRDFFHDAFYARILKPN